MDPELASQATVVRWRDEIRVEAAPCLVVLYGATLGRRLALDRPEVTIGRGRECDLVVELDDVSREHCRIVRHGGAHRVRDLDSTNGTWLNDRLLLPGHEEELVAGDRLRIGGLILKYLAGNDLEALYHEEIYRLTIVDALTGAYNRRYFEEFLEREIVRWRRHRRPLSLALFDVDGLKQMNDCHGHPVGDDALREVSACVRGQVRREACFARLSGDEFAVVLPETTLEAAGVFAERIRGSVEAIDLRARDERIEVTISLGLAEHGFDVAGAAELLARADHHLYLAKQAGRNRIHAG